MPFTYEYACEECGEHFDERRPAVMRDDEAMCPACKGTASVVLSVRGQTVAIPRRFLNGVTRAEVME